MARRWEISSEKFYEYILHIYILLITRVSQSSVLSWKWESDFKVRKTMMVHVHRANADESQMSHRLRRWIFINCLFWLLSIFPSLALWHEAGTNKRWDFMICADQLNFVVRKKSAVTPALCLCANKRTLGFIQQLTFRSWWWRWSQLPKILTKISLCFAAWQCARVVSQVEAWEGKSQEDSNDTKVGGRRMKKITKVN